MQTHTHTQTQRLTHEHRHVMERKKRKRETESSVSNTEPSARSALLSSADQIIITQQASSVQGQVIILYLLTNMQYRERVGGGS